MTGCTGPGIWTQLDGWIVMAGIAAAENGHLEVLKCVFARHGAIMTEAGRANPASAALSHGRLSCLEFAHKHGCMPDPERVAIALRTGHTDCVSYLLAHHADVSSIPFSRFAAENGRLDLLESHMGRGTDWDLAAVGAATGGQLACLRIALENASSRTSDFLPVIAAHGGHASCIRYLYEKGYVAVEGTVEAAVHVGSIGCLQLAFEIGCRPGTDLMLLAARRDLALVQSLHERGCAWEEGTTAAAARRGCLATLQYCHENGCPWDPDTIEAAICTGSVACLQYIHTNDCPPLPHPCPPAYTLEALQYAAEKMGEWGKGVLQSTGTHLQADEHHQFADWRTLMYMAHKEVDLPPVLQQAVGVRFARFAAVVGCFHVARHMRDRGGIPAVRWAAMGSMPESWWNASRSWQT
jgi:hypothetical protein